MISHNFDSQPKSVVSSTRFRTASRQDAPELVALLSATFHTPIDQPTWEWFVYENPLGSSQVYLALGERGQTIVGMLGFAPIQLRLRGVLFAAAYGHHLALKPAHQDGISFVALSRYALQGEALRGVKLLIAPPNRQGYRVQKTLMKWTDFATLHYLRKRSLSIREHDCRELSLFPDQFDAFYARISQKLDFCIEKNTAWMNWRFCRRPGSPYTVYAIFRREQLTGYVVLKRWLEAEGYRKAHIMDLHAIDESSLTQLLAAAESYAIGCQELNLWAIQDYLYRTSLEAMGFEADNATTQPLIARTFDGSSATCPSGSCSFSYGDSDSPY
jgi:hypothetical protein